MSEEVEIDKLEKLIDRCNECKFATCENCEINWIEVQAIKGLLDLYNQEKEKNKELENELDKTTDLLSICNKRLENISRELEITDEHIYGYDYGEIINKIKQEKEKNKEAREYIYDLLNADIPNIGTTDINNLLSILEEV